MITACSTIPQCNNFSLYYFATIRPQDSLRALRQFESYNSNQNAGGNKTTIRCAIVPLLIVLYYFNLGIDLTLIDTFRYLVSNYEH